MEIKLYPKLSNIKNRLVFICICVSIKIDKHFTKVNLTNFKMKELQYMLPEY